MATAEYITEEDQQEVKEKREARKNLERLPFDDATTYHIGSIYEELIENMARVEYRVERYKEEMDYKAKRYREAVEELGEISRLPPTEEPEKIAEITKRLDAIMSRIAPFSNVKDPSRVYYSWEDLQAIIATLQGKTFWIEGMYCSPEIMKRNIDCATRICKARSMKVNQEEEGD